MSKYQESLSRLSKLPQQTLDDIACVIENADHEGDYSGCDSNGGSFWQEDVSATLISLSILIKSLKSVVDDESVLE